MSKTHHINKKIKVLEEQRAKLLLLRKDEIFNILEKAGGIALDNRLLAGLAVYALEENGKSNAFLKELYNLGERKIPSKRRIKAKPKSVGENIKTDDIKAELSANAT